MQRFVVMGVSGCGKTSVGTALAARTGARFVDGDDLHPQTNIEKMSQGVPLTDEDRGPWLVSVGRTLAAPPLPAIVGCSALKRAYRDTIRREAGGAVCFVHLAGSRDVLSERMLERPGHFMPASLLDSQLATLEPPQDDETAIEVDIDQPLVDLVQDVMARIDSRFGQPVA